MWRAHPRKSWTDRSWNSASGNGRTAVFSVSMILTPPSKNTCRLWRPDAMPTFQIFPPKKFHHPTPKYPPRRNDHDRYGLQRFANHLGIFVFPPRRQKAPHRSARTWSFATPEGIKRMAYGLLRRSNYAATACWKRCFIKYRNCSQGFFL